MHYAFRDGEPLTGQELDDTAFFFEVDQQTPVHDVEELVLLVVVVPVELSLHDAEPDDAVVYAAERLVVPLLLDRPASSRTSTSSRKPNASSRLTGYGVPSLTTYSRGQDLRKLAERKFQTSLI